MDERQAEAPQAGPLSHLRILDFTALVQAMHNQMFWEIPIGDGTATFRTPGSPFAFSATTAALHRGVPDLGEHTGQILGDEE